MELTIGHLPSEQVGKGCFGQREHSVHKNAALGRDAPHAMLVLLVWAIKRHFILIPRPAACIPKTGRKPGDH